MRQIHPFHLTLAISSTSTALVLNGPNSNLTSLVGNSFDCWPMETPTDKAPIYTDCTDAIKRLPSFVDTGSFHLGDPSDPFQLPMEKTSGTCTARIELRGSSRARCSWLTVRSHMYRLNTKCFGWSTGNQGGGAEISGQTPRFIDRIFATLEYSGVLGTDWNLTIA